MESKEGKRKQYDQQKIYRTTWQFVISNCRVWCCSRPTKVHIITSNLQAPVLNPGVKIFGLGLESMKCEYATQAGAKQAGNRNLKGKKLKKLDAGYPKATVFWCIYIAPWTPFTSHNFYTRHPLQLLHQTPVTPHNFYNNFYTRHPLHQKPFTPDTFYFWHQTPFTTTFTTNKFYTKHPLHQAPFTPEPLLHQTTSTLDTFYTRHLLHQTPFTPDKFYTKQRLQQTTFTPGALYTRNLLHQATAKEQPLRSSHTQRFSSL